MDAMEGRQVVTCDIPDAFLQANWPEDNDCYLEYEGLMVKIICEIDPNYFKNVLTNKRSGKQKLYGKLTKVVYGTLLGAILFYQKLSGQLYKWRYTQNPYNPCTFNKTVIEQQLTIQFHVDDLKCSHMDQSVLDDLVKQLNDVFQTSKKELSKTKETSMNTSGRYNLKHPNKMGQVVFSMYNSIEDIIGSAPPDMNGTAPDPAKSKLFTIHDNCLY